MSSGFWSGSGNPPPDFQWDSFDYTLPDALPPGIKVFLLPRLQAAINAYPALTALAAEYEADAANTAYQEAYSDLTDALTGWSTPVSFWSLSGVTNVSGVQLKELIEAFETRERELNIAILDRVSEGVNLVFDGSLLALRDQVLAYATAAGDASTAAQSNAAASITARNQAQAYANDAEAFASASQSSAIQADAEHAGAINARTDAVNAASAALTRRDEASAFADAAGASATASETARIAAQAANAAATSQASAALGYRNEAQASASGAASSASAAETARIAAQTANTNAGTAASAALDYRNAAQSASDASQASATASETSRVASAASASQAASSASSAVTSRNEASSFASAAGASATASATSATAAETARGQASTFASQASSSADTAAGHAATASTQAGLAATSAGQAGSSATASANSASQAATSATAAANSASASQTSALAAQTASNDASASASAASVSASQAASSASNAAGSAATATSQAGLAATSASNASGSASAALTSRNQAETFSGQAGSSSAAAASSASAAQTARGQAETFASQAAASADTAAGHAATASTQAGLAATSAGQAAGSATAAQASSSAAATSASQAATSASSASSSANSANTSFNAASAAAAATVPSTFTDVSQWQDYTGQWVPVPVTGGLLRCDGTKFCGPLAKGTIPLLAGRRYRITVKHRVVTDDPLGRQTYHLFGFYFWGANGSGIGLSWIHGAFMTASMGWHTQTYVATAAELLAVAPTAARISAVGLVSYNPNPPNLNSGAVTEVEFIEIADVTDVEAASASASAASVSAGQAATSASNAAGSASTATTQANLAASSASNASSSASAASVSQSAAASSASSAAGSAASASTSAVLSVSGVGIGALNRNGLFADWPNPSGHPTDWTAWTSATGMSRVTGIGSPSALRMVTTTEANHGLMTAPYDGLINTLSRGWYVLCADITLESGSLEGAAAYFQWGPATGSDIGVWINFFTEADTSGVVPGAGVAGRRYFFRKLVQINSPCERGAVFAMNAWASLSPSVVAKTIVWQSCYVRPATQGEIAGRQALAELPALSASLTTTNAVAVDAQGKVNAISGLQTTVNGRVGGFVFANDGTLAGLQIDADYLIVGRPGSGGRKPFRVVNGQTEIEDALIRTLSVYPNASSTIAHRVTLEPLLVAGADGETVSLPGTYGAGIPRIVVDPSHRRPALASGETYEVVAEAATPSSFIVRAKKFTPGTSTVHNASSGTDVGGTPRWRSNKPSSAEADGGVITYRISGTIPRVVHEPAGGGGWTGEYYGEAELWVKPSLGSWTLVTTVAISHVGQFAGPAPTTWSFSARDFQVNNVPALGVSGEYGVHPIGGTVLTAFDDVSYVSTTTSGVAALTGDYPFLVHPPR